MSVDFIDTNDVPYLFDETATRKPAIVEKLIESALQKGSAVISHPVL